MLKVNEKVVHVTKGLVRLLAVDGDSVTLRKSGVVFNDNVSRIRELTPKPTAEVLLANLEKIAGSKVATFTQDTDYYFHLARYGSLEDLLMIMKRFYLIRKKKIPFPLTPEESSIYAFAKDKALHELSYIFEAPIPEIEEYIKAQLHYITDDKK